jgi:thioredoxin-related protein
MRPNYTLLLLAILSLARVGVAEEVRWFADADKAWTSAKEQKRPLLLYFTAANCQYCNDMRTKTFADAEVSDEIRRSFVAATVKGETEEDQKLVETFDVTAYPTIVIVSPDKKVIARMVGYVAPAAFRQRLAALTAKNLQR